MRAGHVGATGNRLPAQAAVVAAGAQRAVGTTASPVALGPFAQLLAALQRPVVLLSGLGVVAAAGLATALVLLLAPGTPVPHDPRFVWSPSHDAGISSSAPRIEMSWSRQPQAIAYSVLWNHKPRDEPDAVPDLPGTAVGTTSPVLAPGRWYFHLRTENKSHAWTHTVHRGPYLIVPPAGSEPSQPSSGGPATGAGATGRGDRRGATGAGATGAGANGDTPGSAGTSPSQGPPDTTGSGGASGTTSTTGTSSPPTTGTQSGTPGGNGGGASTGGTPGSPTSSSGGDVFRPPAVDSAPPSGPPAVSKPPSGPPAPPAGPPAVPKPPSGAPTPPEAPPTTPPTVPPVVPAPPTVGPAVPPSPPAVPPSPPAPPGPPEPSTPPSGGPPADSKPPSGQTVELDGGPYYRTLAVALTLYQGTDDHSGVDPGSGEVQRSTADLASGSCVGWSSTWASVTLHGHADTNVADGRCYRYRYRVADREGNRSAFSPTSDAAKVDTTPPDRPALSISAGGSDTFISDTTVFYRPTGAGGTFTVAATSDDAGSGLKSIAFPGLAGGFTPLAVVLRTAPPFEVAYTWHGGSPDAGTKTVTAYDRADNPRTASFTVVADEAGPVGMSARVSGGPWFTTPSVPVEVEAGSDAGSGLDKGSLVVERDSAPLSSGECGDFAGSWSAVTLTGNADADVHGGSCYRYRVSVSDNVGNRSTSDPSQAVRVDTSPPAEPELALSESSSSLFVVGHDALLPAREVGGFGPVRRPGDDERP